MVHAFTNSRVHGANSVIIANDLQYSSSDSKGLLGCHWILVITNDNSLNLSGIWVVSCNWGILL